MVVWGAATFAVVPPLQMRVCVSPVKRQVCLHQSILVPLTWKCAGSSCWWCGNFRWAGISFVPVMGAIVAGLALLLVFIQPENNLKQFALPTAN